MLPPVRPRELRAPGAAGEAGNDQQREPDQDDDDPECVVHEDREDDSDNYEKQR